MIKLTKVDKSEARVSIMESAQLNVSYISLNVIATVIACAGLLANSTAVIIGSMLIATLLSPIAGTALAIIKLDGKGIINGIGTLLIGVLMVISVAYLFGHFFSDIEPTERMFARTDPGVFDFIIAFFGGIAGGMALIIKRYSNIMIGVGIATALVPPLSTAGIFFAKSEFILGLKAFELASINIGFILIANFLVFAFYKLNNK